MKELVILSGKGGTGKTSITAALASLALERDLAPLCCDADVDAADLHLILTPDICKVRDFSGGHTASIHREHCTDCGLCLDLCRFDAISDDYQIDPFACEGCGVCSDLCPANAIEFKETVCGQWFESDTRFGPFIHARLDIGQENSGKLVARVREEARSLAEQTDRDFILTDGPPGIGCPVIASISQATAVLIVAEPTVSGLHDMKRVIELCRHFKLPAMVCINKYDLNPVQTLAIERYALEHQIRVVGRIGFDPIFTHAMIQEKTIIEYHRQTAAGRQIEKMWTRILSHLQFSLSFNEHPPFPISTPLEQRSVNNEKR